LLLEAVAVLVDQSEGLEVLVAVNLPVTEARDRVAQEPEELS
jgi:hypothetical protein